MDLGTTPPTRPSPRQRRMTVAVALITVAIVAGAVIAWVKRDEMFGETIDPGTPLPASTELTAAETEFYDFVAPRFRALAGESRELAALGRAKSRNLIELQRRGDRVDDVSQQIDDYVAAHQVPHRFVGAHRRYLIGIEAVRRAKDESRSAFVSFDWDRVAQAVETMEAGANELSLAVQELEEMAGYSTSGSPTSVP